MSDFTPVPDAVPTDEEITRCLAEDAMGCAVFVERLSDEHVALVESANCPAHFGVFDSGGIALCGAAIPNGLSGHYFRPLTYIPDSFMVQSAVEKMGQQFKERFANYLFNDIAGGLEIVGTLKVHWGMINATARQRGLAAYAAIKGKTK